MRDSFVHRRPLVATRRCAEVQASPRPLLDHASTIERVLTPPNDLDNLGVGSWLERRSWFVPDDVALVARDRSYTYSELAERVRRLANGFRQLGVSRGDRVAWVGPNSPAFLESLFAAGLVGAVMAPVNHWLGSAAIRSVLVDSAPCLLIQHSSMGTLHAPDSVRHRVAVEGQVSGCEDFEELIMGSPDHLTREDVTLEDLCMLAQTSGTTGRPKAIMLTHGNVTWNAINVSVTAGMRSDDVTIALAPFFRTGGTGVNVLPVLYSGGCVISPDNIEPDRILELSESRRVTVGFANPDLLYRLVHSPLWTEVDLSNLRFVITGGAPVSEPLIRAFLDRGIPLLQGYGLSEAAPACLLLHHQDALERVGSAGKPFFNVGVRIVDESSTPVEPGGTGELQVRGPNVMKGYWNRPELTAEVFTSDGWLRTGDAGRMDSDGYFWIVDRMENGFVSDGTLIYPGDIEKALLAHDGVEDVALVGVLDHVKGMVGAAVVVLTDGAQVTEEDLLEACREKLTPPQVPYSITFVESIPRSSVGKVQRDEITALVSQQS